MKSKPKKGNAPELLPSEASSVKNPAFNQGIDMTDSKALTIAGTAVRQMNGLYSLNDLHKAAGGEAMGLMPDATHVDTNGRPVYSLKQVSEKLGVPVQELEECLQSRPDADWLVHRGPVSPLH